MKPSRPAQKATALYTCLALLAPLSASAVAPEPAAGRIALVIGNGAYVASPLVNPARDARAVAERLREAGERLREAGFRVTLKVDSPRRELQEAIRGFGDALARDNRAVGVFYYAGHGVQLNWRNFMLPVDVRITRPSDIAAQGVDVGLLLESLGRARNPLNLVILDACRNNPFGTATTLLAAIFAPMTGGSRSSTRRPARCWPMPPHPATPPMTGTVRTGCTPRTC